MTKKELDELKEDKDMDGIPDKYDSTFNPPDEKYHYAIVTPSLCEYLKEHDFSFSKCKRETENNDIEEEDDFGENYYKCEINSDINNINLYNKNVGNNNVFINKKRKFMKNNNKKNKLNNYNTNYETEDKKNYKLKVNLLKSERATSGLQPGLTLLREYPSAILQ